MLPSPPKEDKDVFLPKTCYFSDGRTKVDYVIVVPKIEEHVRGDNSELVINKFVEQAQEKELLVEREEGKFHTNLIFLKIHGSHKTLTRFAGIYNIELTCQNPYYKYKEKIWPKCLANDLTRPKPGSSCYKRAEKTLSGVRPTDFTTAERSKIVYEILKRISFVFKDEEYSMSTLLERDIFLEHYPIHDGDGVWTKEGPLTDYQLLVAFWPSFKYIFHKPPIHLIEKYYGPKIGFYFALLHLYNQMLIVPTIVGTLTVIAGLLQLNQDDNYIEEEVCHSDITLCSDQKLQTACGLVKLAFVIDNPVTIFYVIMCSFWGVVFWNLWQRRQAMLRLRWNLMSIKADRTMRRDFQENAKTRKSSISGETEYYVPVFKKFVSTVFTYFIITVMILLFFMLTLLVVEYRFFLRKLLNYDETYHANEIEIFTSSAVTSIVITILNSCVPFVLKIYARIIKFLTLLRMPRTQLQYNRMYLHMMFIISFANHFSPLFYLAYIKGLFHTYPGSVSKIIVIKLLQSDLCKPGGCMVDLGVQLITLMITKTLIKWSFRIVAFLGAPWTKQVLLEVSNKKFGQWETDFLKSDLNEATVNQLYTELVLQYSFITFFNASLPVIGLIALVHNLIKSQHDVYKFLRLYRRPVMQKVPDIEGWDQVLRAVTVFGCISNSFVVAFRSNFIQRVLYRQQHKTLKGYINSTLSVFAIRDFQTDIIIDHGDQNVCYYRGYRYPPDHEKKYQPTEQYWQHLAIRAVYFILLEKVTFLLSMILGYLIPEIPRKVKVKLEYDEKLLKMTREAQLESGKKG